MDGRNGPWRWGGISLARVHEVIDVPPPTGSFQAGMPGASKGRRHPWMSTAQCFWRVSEPSERTVRRLPLEPGVEVSSGAIVEGLPRLCMPASSVRNDLVVDIQASPAIHAEETGWQDSDLPGSIWMVSPQLGGLTRRITRVREPPSDRRAGRPARACGEATSTQRRTSLRGCLNGVGCMTGFALPHRRPLSRSVVAAPGVPAHEHPSRVGRLICQ